MKNYTWIYKGIELVAFLVLIESVIPLLGQTAEAEKANAESAFVEESIYIPYDNLQDVFETEGRGVFVPYQEFQALWNAARQDPTTQTTLEEPPVSHMVSKLSADLAVEDRVVRGTMTFTVEFLKSGWYSVPLRLPDTAVVNATLDGAPARLHSGEGTPGYHLIHFQEKGASTSHNLTLKVARRFHEQSARNVVKFRTARVPQSSWTLRVPQSGIDIEIEPETAAAGELTSNQEENYTELTAFLGTSPEVALRWTPRKEGARNLSTLYRVATNHIIDIEQGRITDSATLNYTIRRAPLPSVELQIPTDYRITEITNDFVQNWSVIAETDTHKTVNVEFFRPISDNLSLTIVLERFTEETTLTLPTVTAAGATQQTGKVSVEAVASLQTAFTTEGEVRQVGTVNGRTQFRFTALPYELITTLTPRQPRLQVQSHARASVMPTALQIDYTALVTIENGGIFHLKTAIPADYEVVQVSARYDDPRGPNKGVLKDYHRDEDVADTLVVTFRQRINKQVKLMITLRRELNESALQSPSAEPARLPIPLPRIQHDQLEQFEGIISLYTPDNLQATIPTQENLRRIGRDDIPESLQNQQFQKADHLLQAFSYGKTGGTLAIKAVRRRPQIVLHQFRQLRVEPGVLKHEVHLRYQIKHSSVDNLRVDVPTELIDRIHLATPDIRHQEIKPAPDDLADNYTAWHLTGDAAFLGEQEISLSWESPIEKQDVGASLTVELQRLLPRGTDRTNGQVVLAAAENIDARPVSPTEGLRPIDPEHDLMTGLQVPDISRAFEFVGPWRLAVKMTRYEQEPLASTTIDRAYVRTVLTRNEEISVQALYRVTSTLQRLRIQLPPDAEFDRQPLRLNGSPVDLEQGQENEYHIPLTDLPPRQPFLIDLRYVFEPEDGDLELPVFVEKPALQRIYLSVYQPKERRYLGVSGPWSSQQKWDPDILGWRPIPKKSDEEVLNWVYESLPMSRKTLTSFATDGKHLLFSSLRPPFGEDGRVQVRSMSRTWLNTWALLLILGFGSWMLTKSWQHRLLSLASIVSAGLVLAVFVPEFLGGLMTAGTICALAIIVLAWFLRDLMGRERNPENCPPWIPARNPDSAPSPASASGDVETKAHDDGSISADPTSFTGQKGPADTDTGDTKRVAPDAEDEEADEDDTTETGDQENRED